MNIPPHEEAGRWLTEAGVDLSAAAAMVRSRHYNWACFLAQQAAEKAAKALLYAKGVEDPWGHSVADLLEDGATYDPQVAPLQPKGALLDKFYIPTRYPNGLPGGLPSKAFSQDEAEQAIALSASLVEAIRGICAL